MGDLSAFVALHLAYPFSPRKSLDLIQRWGGMEALWSQTIEADSPLFTILQTGAWEKEIERAAKAGIRLLCLDDPEYPAALKQLSDPPLLIYCKGALNLCDREAIAIVGTRAASIYGMSMAERFGREVAAAGCTVVSGLARGIDTAAHQGALKTGTTIGIIGSGLHCLYPKENVRLAEEIAERGALISEYPLNTPPDKFQFPRRNRLIAALSLGCLLIEGAVKSGGMITIDRALELGKPCFTIPGRIDIENFSGNHALLKTGKGKLVENPQEMLSLLVPKREKTAQLTNVATTNLNSKESEFIALFTENEISFEELGLRSQLPVSSLNALLSALLLKNAVRQLPGRLFKKV